MSDDRQDDDKQRLAKRNIRTALVLAAVAVLFYVAFVLKTVLSG